MILMIISIVFFIGGFAFWLSGISFWKESKKNYDKAIRILKGLE